MLLLLCAVPDQRQRADAGVCAKRRGKAGQHRQVIGDHRRGTLSIPMPPYSSGISTDVNPSSLAFRIMAGKTPGSLASIAVAAGKISSRANCAAVVAIWRCSSFKSSGMNTSAGSASLEQKAAACCGYDWKRGRRGHSFVSRHRIVRRHLVVSPIVRTRKASAGGRTNRLDAEGKNLDKRKTAQVERHDPGQASKGNRVRLFACIAYNCRYPNLGGSPCSPFLSPC